MKKRYIRHASELVTCKGSERVCKDVVVEPHHHTHH